MWEAWVGKDEVDIDASKGVATGGEKSNGMGWDDLLVRYFSPSLNHRTSRAKAQTNV